MNNLKNYEIGKFQDTKVYTDKLLISKYDLTIHSLIYYLE